VGNSEQLHAVQVAVLADAPVDAAQSVEPLVLAHLAALELEALAIPVALELGVSAVLVCVAQLEQPVLAALELSVIQGALAAQGFYQHEAPRGW
jgi:hypothetical protein